MIDIHLITVIEPDVKPVGRRTEIVERMQLTYAADFTPRPVFDGQHLLYSSRQLPCELFPAPQRTGSSASVHIHDQPFHTESL
jgi:hypothetical protein